MAVAVGVHGRPITCEGGFRSAGAARLTEILRFAKGNSMARLGHLAALNHRGGARCNREMLRAFVHGLGWEVSA
jgi:hypothetical protein